jgi:dynein heavy chain
MIIFLSFVNSKTYHKHDSSTHKKDLDTMVINIINKAFEQIKVIGTAVHLLLSFRQLAFRPAIQLCVSKKSADVRMLFKKQCQSIRQEFDDFHRKPPLRMNEPRFAGAALWAKSLSATIDDGWTIVKDSTTIGKSDIDELEVFVDNLKSALYSYQSQKYNDWLDTFSDMDTASFQQRLNQVRTLKIIIKLSNLLFI